MRLADGAAFGLQAETDIAFEDTLPDRHLTDAPLPPAAGWLGDLIERSRDLGARQPTIGASPHLDPAPMAALADPDTPMAAEAGVLRSKLLPRKSASTSCDASVSDLEDLALDRVDAFRRCGFRAGLDARKSWRTPMGAAPG